MLACSIVHSFPLFLFLIFYCTFHQQAQSLNQQAEWVSKPVSQLVWELLSDGFMFELQRGLHTLYSSQIVAKFQTEINNNIPRSWIYCALLNFDAKLVAKMVKMMLETKFYSSNSAKKRWRRIRRYGVKCWTPLGIISSTMIGCSIKFDRNYHVITQFLLFIIFHYIASPLFTSRLFFAWF